MMFVEIQPWTFRGSDECIVRYTRKYMNRGEVQKALHANVTHLPYPWATCSSIVRRNWTDSPKSMLPIFKQLISSGIRIWVFRCLINSIFSSSNPFELENLMLFIFGSLKKKNQWYV